MTEDPDEAAGGEAGRRPPLRAVHGPLASAEPPPEVRLVREWKGLLVADLLRPDVAARLPGQVLRALHHLERGDLAAAERHLPAAGAVVLAGPGHARARRRAWLLAFAAAALAGLLAAAWWLA